MGAFTADPEAKKGKDAASRTTPQHHRKEAGAIVLTPSPRIGASGETDETGDVRGRAAQ